MNCVMSVGLLGSWYFICATSSFRNASLSRLWSCAAGAVAFLLHPVLMLGTLVISVIDAPGVLAVSDPHVEAATRGRGGGEGGQRGRVAVRAPVRSGAVTGT